MFKRVILFMATNLAVIWVMSIVMSIFNIGPYLTQYGINHQSLFIFALLFGFFGSFISLFLSKWMAMRAFKIQLIKEPKTALESWLYTKVHEMSEQRKIAMPDLGIYNSKEPNAFATGWNKDKSLLAVSSGLLSVMDQDEIEGVLGHEISHIANGDMVTLALIQGVVNTFVIFFARIAALFVTQFFKRNAGEGVQDSFVYYGIALVFEMFFGILATLIVMWFSRHREYRADAGSARYLGKEKMIKALQRLQALTGKVGEDERAPAFNTMKISRFHRGWFLFSSHPPLEDRIAALEHA